MTIATSLPIPPLTTQSEPVRRAVGMAAMAVTVLVWAGFALSIRGISDSTLSGIDAALIRFTTPLIVLAPWVPRAFRRIRRERIGVILALCFSGGLPYFLVAALGGSLTSAGLVGIVIPGTVPVFAALIAFLLWGSRIGAARMTALAAIVAGVAVAVLAAGGGRAVGGIMVLLVGGSIWSVYTLSLRVTVVDKVSAAIVLCLPSAAVCMALVVAGSVPSALAGGTAEVKDVLLFVGVQGLGVGVVSAVCYGVGIALLGSPAATTFGALSPAVTLALAVPVFGEPATPALLLTLGLVVGGVIAFTLMPRRSVEAGRCASVPAGS